MLVKKVDVRSTRAALQLSAAVGRDVRVQRDGAGCRGLLLDVCKAPEGFPAPFRPSPKLSAVESHPAFAAPVLQERYLGAGTNCRLAEGVVFCGGDFIISYFAFLTKELAGVVPRCRISVGQSFSPWLSWC